MNENKSEINKRLFEEWLEHPITKLVKKEINFLYDDSLEVLLSGVQDTNITYALIGEIKAYSNILRMQYRDIQEGTIDD